MSTDFLAQIMTHRAALALLAIFATSPISANDIDNLVAPAPISNSLEYLGIDNYIRSLSYDRHQQLTHRGESLNLTKSTQGVLQDGKFVLISRSKKSMIKENSALGVNWESDSQIFPGSLLLANDGIVNKTPEVLSFDRKPLDYVMYYPYTSKKKIFRIVPHSYGKYRQILQKTLETLPDSLLAAPALWEKSRVYSRDQLVAQFGLHGQNLDSLAIDFDAIENDEVETSVFECKQIFYSVGLELPTRASGLFSESVTASELAEKGVNSLNPLVLVTTVHHGRLVYLTETKSTRDPGKRSINVACVLGCNKTMIEDLAGVKDLRSANNVLNAHLEFHWTNPAVPISYNAKFVGHDGNFEWAILRSGAEYLQSTRMTFGHGFMELGNRDGNSARIVIKWDEVKYDESGRILISKNWTRNEWELTGAMAMLQRLVSRNAENVEVEMQADEGMTWKMWGWMDSP